MPNPTERHSKTRGAKRRTHYKAKAMTTGACPNCGANKLAHTACPECGYYNGRKIIASV